MSSVHVFFDNIDEILIIYYRNIDNLLIKNINI